MNVRLLSALAIAAAAAAWQPRPARAFCGFYVSGAGGELFNNATQVVLMREGTRTVLSMQNNYQGPPSDFAMVVPVPVVLQEDNVKTLTPDIFMKVDTLAAPRLVEYWEQDPCRQYLDDESGGMGTPMALEEGKMGMKERDRDHGVTIEAKFTVGEYDIVILGAKDSSGLEAWLHENGYKIPDGAEPYLRPYVAAGSKFFVAKVDVTKVKFASGQAMLSPLRFHYDSDEFSLPVRLGLMNSSGKQDLIVHILARGQRYQVANYKNVTIPTNLDVKDTAKPRFGEFYAALFDRTLEKNPGAVVTEYAWDASSCDPCPIPALDGNELATLGLDVLDQPAPTGGGAAGGALDPNARPPARPRRPPMRGYSGGFVLTRLHARYSKDALGQDLVFETADPIWGGREVPGPDGKLEEGAVPSGYNNFQARYAIRHRWTGAVACDHPMRGRWGGPPSDPSGVGGGMPPGPVAARDLAFAPRGKMQLAAVVAQDVPEIGVVAGAAGASAGSTAAATDQPPPRPSSRSERKIKKGCDCAATDVGDPGALLGLLFIAGAALWSARRRSR